MTAVRLGSGGLQARQAGQEGLRGSAGYVLCKLVFSNLNLLVLVNRLHYGKKQVPVPVE